MGRRYGLGLVNRFGSGNVFGLALRLFRLFDHPTGVGGPTRTIPLSVSLPLCVQSAATPADHGSSGGPPGRGVHVVLPVGRRYGLGLVNWFCLATFSARYAGYLWVCLTTYGS